MYDLIIIGSGPAGMGAAVYAKRAGLEVAVLEKTPLSGGQVLNTYDVDNYLGIPSTGGFDLSQKFRAHGDKLGVPVLTREVTGLLMEGDTKTVLCEEGNEQTRAVLLATGAEHAKLEVPGEEELAGMGVSYCATCDGAFFRGRTVAVVGGGDVALEDAIYLARGCEKVYVIHRRDAFRGAKILQDELLALPNVEVLYQTKVEKICGEDQVEKLLLADTVTGETSELAVDGIFIAVGIHPETELVKNLVKTDEAGYVIAGEDGITEVPGLFVAGDIRKKPLRQIITAVADGANAATSAAAYLK